MYSARLRTSGTNGEGPAEHEFSAVLTVARTVNHHSVRVNESVREG